MGQGFWSAEEFWSKVEKADDGCWYFGSWRAPRYTQLRWRRRTVYAHRLAYELATGQSVPPRQRGPGGLVVTHSCDNPPCVNPAHLKLGTQSDNLRECVARGRYARGPLSRKLHASDVDAIRASRAAGASQAELAERFGVSQPMISRIVTGKSWLI